MTLGYPFYFSNHNTFCVTKHANKTGSKGLKRGNYDTVSTVGYFRMSITVEYQINW